MAYAQTWLGHISINDRGWLVRQWAWRTRTGSAPPRLPTSRAKPRFLWATSIITSRPRTRLARRSSSGGWRSYPRSGSDGAKLALPRIGFAPASKASSRTRIAWRSAAALSGRFAPSSTGRAARSPPERPRSSLNTWPGSRASFGRSERGKTPTALPCTCFPPCKAFRSWLMPFMTPVLWRRRPSGSRVGFKACETPGGLNPQAHTTKPEASPAKCASRLVSQLTRIQQALSRQKGAFMKIILIGANGKIGELVQKALAGAGYEIVKVGRKSGDFRVEIENRESVRKLYQAVGSFDAVAIAAGEVAFAPLSELTAEKWQFSLGGKLMGQINLVQEAIPFIKEKGSFTLVSGILNDDPIFAGVAASTVSGALEAFVRAAAIELPKGLRINVVSPTMLKESESQFAKFFIGMIPVEGWKVGQAYKRAILGAQTGRVYKVD